MSTVLSSTVNSQIPEFITLQLPSCTRSTPMLARKQRPVGCSEAPWICDVCLLVSTCSSCNVLIHLINRGETAGGVWGGAAPPQSSKKRILSGKYFAASIFVGPIWKFCLCRTFIAAFLLRLGFLNLWSPPSWENKTEAPHWRNISHS